MPLVYQQNINLVTKLGVWHISEPENFFLQQVPLKRSITHPNKRLQHLAGRYLLQELYPNFPYSLIRIADTRKPFIENEMYHFSISHCGTYAAAIVSTGNRVGADVELMTTKVIKVKHKFLSEKEQAMIDNLSLSNLSDLYFQLLTTAWSIKESLYKLYGDNEVDFIEHLQIEKINMNDNEGIAECRFLKDTAIELQVHFLWFNNNCVSWVVS